MGAQSFAGQCVMKCCAPFQNVIDTNMLVSSSDLVLWRSLTLASKLNHHRHVFIHYFRAFENKQFDRIAGRQNETCMGICCCGNVILKNGIKYIK